MEDREREAQGGEAEVQEFVSDDRGGINYNLIFLCAVSLLLGLAVKTEFSKRYTIGFDDGMIRQAGKNAIDLSMLEQQVADKQQKAQEEAAKAQQQQLQDQAEESGSVSDAESE